MSDLLPPNATAQERAISLAIEREVPVAVRDVWNPDTCPGNVLAWLAWAFSVDEWDAGWTDAQKRAVIKNAIEVQKHKGTIGAVQNALAALSVDTRVQEWFNQVPEGEPYTFKLLIEADQAGIGQAGAASLYTVLERTKNLRSHLDEIEVSVKTKAGPQAAIVPLLGNDITMTGFEWATAVTNETTICM